MERKIPTEGSFYRHFMGKLYQIKHIAIQSETGEKTVVYQALFAPFNVWVTPLGKFLGEVDTARYPDATQRYYFQEVVYQNQTLYYTRDVEQSDTGQMTDIDTEYARNRSDNTDDTGDAVHDQPSVVSDEELKKILLSGQAERKLSGILPDEEIGTRGFMIFLDCENYRERRDIFLGLKPYMNDFLLHNIAVSLDVALEEGTLQESFESILHCIDAYEKYEGGRLR